MEFVARITHTGPWLLVASLSHAGFDTSDRIYQTSCKTAGRCQHRRCCRWTVVANWLKFFVPVCTCKRSAQVEAALAQQQRWRSAAIRSVQWGRDCRWHRTAQPQAGFEASAHSSGCSVSTCSISARPAHEIARMSHPIGHLSAIRMRQAQCREPHQAPRHGGERAISAAGLPKARSSYRDGREPSTQQFALDMGSATPWAWWQPGESPGLAALTGKRDLHLPPGGPPQTAAAGGSECGDTPMSMPE